MNTQAVQTVSATQTTPNTSSVQSTSGTQAIQGVLPPYRINLKLDGAYKEFLADEAWRRRTTITGLINELIGNLKREVEGPEA